jgi:hypothetical protein
VVVSHVTRASIQDTEGTYTMTRHRIGRWAGALGLCLAAAVSLPAQEVDQPAAPPAPAPVPTPTPGPAPNPTPTPTPRVARRVAAPTFALGVGGPLIASASAGVILGKDRALPDECPSPRGFLLQGEAGVAGAKLSAGPVFTYCHSPFGSLGAGSLQVVYARTWGNPLGTEPDLDYWGGEIRVGVIDWRVTLGLLKRAGSEERGATWLFTWGIARGF